MTPHTLRVALSAGAVIVVGALSTWAQTPAAIDAAAPRDPPPPLTGQMLKDEKLIAKGMAIWQDTCAHCHGSKAYPGKAPKLEPRRYKPEFVWDRVHNGFRAMPPWKDIFPPDDVIAVVAYVMSDDFWP